VQAEAFSGALLPFTGTLLRKTEAGFEAMNAAMLTRLQKDSVSDRARKESNSGEQIGCAATETGKRPSQFGMALERPPPAQVPEPPASPMLVTCSLCAVQPAKEMARDEFTN
jgi:hypothetical protein